MIEFSEWPASSKIMLERGTVNVVISEVDAVMYVVLSKAAKHVPYGDQFLAQNVRGLEL